MRGNPKFLKRMAAVALLAVGAPAMAADYLPWKEGDTGVYTGSPFESAREMTADFVFGPWSHFTEFVGLGPNWAFTGSGERIYLFDASTGARSLLTNFNAAVGFTTKLNAQPCNVGEVVLAAKGLEITVPAGHFDDVVRLDLKPSCADAGVVSMWFAKGVGPIKWAESNIAGLQTYSLAKGMINGVKYPRPMGLAVRGLFPHPEIWINVMPPGPPVPPTVPVSLKLANHTLRDVTYQFNTSQRFDIVLRDARGNVILRWSDGKAFLQVLGEITLAPGDTYEVGGGLTLAYKDGTPVVEGDYNLEIHLATSTAGTPVGSPAASMPVMVRWAH